MSKNGTNSYPRPLALLPDEGEVVNGFNFRPASDFQKISGKGRRTPGSVTKTQVRCALYNDSRPDRKQFNIFIGNDVMKALRWKAGDFCEVFIDAKKGAALVVRDPKGTRTLSNSKNQSSPCSAVVIAIFGFKRKTVAPVEFEITDSGDLLITGIPFEAESGKEGSR